MSSTAEERLKKLQDDALQALVNNHNLPITEDKSVSKWINMNTILDNMEKRLDNYKKNTAKTPSQ